MIHKIDSKMAINHVAALLFVAMACLVSASTADTFIVTGLEDAANWMPSKLYLAKKDSGNLSRRSTVSADRWFRTIMVDPSGRFAVLWTNDIGSRSELERHLSLEERNALRESKESEHVIIIPFTGSDKYGLVSLENSPVFGGTLAFERDNNLCAMTPDYTNEVASLVSLETGGTSIIPLHKAPWGRLALRGPLYPVHDAQRINPSAIYRFIIDGDSGKLCHYMGSLDREHYRFAASERLPEGILERYATSGCIRGWLECGNGSVGLYRFFPEGVEEVLSEECDWLIHDRSRDGWSWKSDYDFIGYALLFDERIIFYEGHWEGRREDGSRRYVRTGRHRCTNLALNTLFEFKLPIDAMVLNIIDDSIIYRTGTTLWAVAIIENQRIGEPEELCTDNRLEYANWVAAAPEEPSKDE